MSSAEMSLINSVLDTGDVREFVALGLTESDFGVVGKDIFNYISNHLKAYGKIPDPSTVKSSFGIDLQSPVEPSKYYADIVKKKALQRNLRTAVVGASSLLQDMKPDEALKSLVETSLALSIQKHGNKILDFREAGEVIGSMYREAAMSPDSRGLRFGWDYLDAMTGGVGGGDLLSIIGRPCMGKTFLLLYVALSAWKLGNKSVMFVSMEMKPQVLFQRLAAMYTGKSLTKLMTADFSSTDFSSFITDIEGIPEEMPPFYVIDGNLSASVEDIWVLARQLQPEAIFIDGAYLVRHPDPRMNKYSKIEANCEMFKNILATDLDLPVCLSYQFNRDAVKTKKDESAGLEHIAGSDAIGQLSSVVLGLMQEENIETLTTRLISVLKGRNGEIGEFRINWDFQNMCFSQVKDFDYDDLDIT